MSGSFIYRHHVEPRVKLYMPEEESFPIPSKYVDVTRTTYTSLDVFLEKKQIEDYLLEMQQQSKTRVIFERRLGERRGSSIRASQDITYRCVLLPAFGDPQLVKILIRQMLKIAARTFPGSAEAQ